jgi:hypothetical protein
MNRINDFFKGNLFSRTMLTVLLLITIFLMGCATVGHDFPDAQVLNVRLNKTTQDEIRAMFGSPWRVGIEDGQRTWTYGKYRYKLFGQSSTKDLVVRFNDKNIVVSYTFNTTDHDK